MSLGGLARASNVQVVFKAGLIEDTLNLLFRKHPIKSYKVSVMFYKVGVKWREKVGGKG